jgi:hypothetical protein
MKIHGAAAVALALLVGCGPAASTEAWHADIRGRVTGVIAASDRMHAAHVEGFVRVEGARQSDTRYDKAALTITDTTMITAYENEAPHSVLFPALEAGDSVEAGFTGPVRQSYPVQATAAWIRIIARR